MKAGAVNVFNALSGTGATPLLFVHDELVVESQIGATRMLTDDPDKMSAFEVRQEIRRLEAARNRCAEDDARACIQADIDWLREALRERGQ